MGHYFLDTLPIPAAYLLIVLLILVSCEVGFRIGRYYDVTEPDASAVTSVGPMLGGLLGMLGFVLAFTFSMASEQHGVRKHDVLEEASIIGTAYLRADLIDEPHAGTVRTLLRDYVAVRLQAATPGADMGAAIRRSLEIHDALWREVSSAAVQQGGAVPALAVESVNDLIDMHEQRFTEAVLTRIPGVIWLGLGAITILTMVAMGLHAGLAGKRRLMAVTPIALAFAMLATLVLDLNRPQGGFITVSQRAMVDAQAGMTPLKQVDAPSP